MVVLMLKTVNTIQGVCEDDNLRRIYVGTLMFGMSASVYVPKGSEPEPGVHKVFLKLELLGVYLYVVVEGVNVIKLGKRTRKKYN